jgi:pimeloyl-ACP methyl ester carboxylesterase
VDTLADDCAALLDHLGVGRANVVGHSMGGFVAQRLALRHPDRVERIVLVATSDGAGADNVEHFFALADRLDAGEDRATWFRSLFEAIFTRRFMADPVNVDAALHWALDYPYPQSPAAFRRQCEAMAAFDGRADLMRIARPALVVSGREDILFPARSLRGVRGASARREARGPRRRRARGAYRATEGVRRRRRGIPRRVRKGVS